jgi:hypothetical protein
LLYELLMLFWNYRLLLESFLDRGDRIGHKSTVRKLVPYRSLQK